MQIHVYEGWPLRYAHIAVDALRAEHANHGTICLWAEDDPAQIAGRDLQTLWERLDAWAEKAQRGFGAQDQALDGHMLFEDRSNYRAELPFGDLVRQGHTGFRAQLLAKIRNGKTLLIEPQRRDSAPTEDATLLRGAFYLHRNVPTPPRNLEQVRAALTKNQKKDLDRGLAERAPVGLAEPSGGYDFIVLAWRRFGLEHDAVVVGFQGEGESLRAFAVAATPNDIGALKRRAGRDVDALGRKKVLVAGTGSVGGHVASTLASSGVGTLHLYDDDYLATANLVRHVAPKALVGYKKTLGVALVVDDHAPWATVEQHGLLPHGPTDLAKQVAGMDLVVDCTGVFSVTAALAEVCGRENVPLITGALFHQGAVARTQRQAEGDTALAARRSDPAYLDLPPEAPGAPDTGFLELGCTSPVNNAPPTAVLSLAADVSDAAVDLLSGRLHRSDERISVLRPMSSPFDRVGVIDAPKREASAT